MARKNAHLGSFRVGCAPCTFGHHLLDNASPHRFLTKHICIPLSCHSHTGSDDLIGRTVIDLEDRWFDARWQALGQEHMLLPGADASDPTKVSIWL